MKTENKLGFWVALTSSLFAVLWFVTFNMQDVFQSVPNWKNLQEYAKAFHISRLTYIYPSMLLAITYLIMVVCIHRNISESKKLWSHIALVVGILYAAMASINYNIQAVAVRMSLAANETGGIELFLPDNNHSVFTALANSYVYMSVSLFFLGFAFTTGKKEKWIRWLLFAQLISAIGQTAYSMFDAPDSLFIASSMVWVIGAPAAFVLIAFWFRQKQIK